MLTCGEAYVDQGQQRCEAPQRQRSVAALKRRAAPWAFNSIPWGRSHDSVRLQFCFLREQLCIGGARPPIRRKGHLRVAFLFSL